MGIRSTAVLAAVSLSVVGLAVSAQDQKQDPKSSPAVIRTTPAGPTTALGFVAPQVSQGVSPASGRDSFRSLATLSPFGVGSRMSETEKAIDTTVRKLKEAESDRERDDARKTLAGLLSKDYDERLEGYEKQLEEMEKRLNDMRARLSRRRRAKDDMIALRLKVLEAEADDLGWPSRTRRSDAPGGNPFSPGTVELHYGLPLPSPVETSQPAAESLLPNQKRN